MAEGRLAVLETAHLALAKKVEAYKPISGANIDVTDAIGGSGRAISTRSKGQTPTGAGFQGPWAILAAPTAGKVIVSLNAPLRVDPILDNIATIVSVTDEFTPAIGSLLYLKIDYTAGVVTTITLTMDVPWAAYSIPYTVTGAGTVGDPFVIASSYYLIGYGLDPTDDNASILDGPLITLGDSSTVKVVRCCYAPLLLEFTNMGSGFLVQYPTPPSMPGPPA